MKSSSVIFFSSKSDFNLEMPFASNISIESINKIATTVVKCSNSICTPRSNEGYKDLISCINVVSIIQMALLISGYLIREPRSKE